MDCEAFDDGYIAAILVKEGGTAPVGAPCAVLVANQADIAKVSAGGAAPAQAAAPAGKDK